MSQCWTITHMGMVPGIELSGPHQGQPFVEVGVDYVRHARVSTKLTRSTRLVRRPSMVLFHNAKPPLLRSNRLMHARIKHRGVQPYLWRSSRDDKGILVYVDTSHTEGYELGGNGWSVNDTNLVKEFACGYDGHSFRTVPSEDPNAAPVQEVDMSTCYKKGLLLIMPGGILTVNFNAPGTLTAEVTFDGESPSFCITQSAIDRNYELLRRLHSSPSFEQSGGLFYDPFSDNRF